MLLEMRLNQKESKHPKSIPSTGCANEIRTSFNKVIFYGRDFSHEDKDEILRISDRLDKLGFEVRATFADHSSNQDIQPLIIQGLELCRDLERVCDRVDSILFRRKCIIF
jgi:hypothetical protein